jgi:hypothetical protein
MLREECRLRVFENRVLTRIFGPKRDEVKGGLLELAECPQCYCDEVQQIFTNA